jgi:RNA-directed DNA polymerase
MISKTKPFCIEKQRVMESWERVKANGGTYGVDEETIKEFESNLKANLFKVWNRMSSGSYFPPAVRGVEIPKKDGSKRMLGIATVADRVAQGVVKSYLEPIVEPKFHEDSYGYRPGKSAIEAVGVARVRCWGEDWIIDLDIRQFFDSIDHELMMQAVRHHTKKKGTSGKLCILLPGLISIYRIFLPITVFKILDHHKD